jgi:hypothetical protein
MKKLLSVVKQAVEKAGKDKKKSNIEINFLLVIQLKKHSLADKAKTDANVLLL